MRALNTWAAVALVVVLTIHSTEAAGCPRSLMLKGSSAQDHDNLPDWHPAIDTSATGSTNIRTLKQAASLPAGYADAVRRLLDDPVRGLRLAVKDCLISPTFMRYTQVPGPLNNSDAVFPAGAWLRAFFHDAGTFLKQPTKGKRAGGPNGSLGLGCPDNTCGKCVAGTAGCFNTGGTDPAPISAAAGSKCADGSPAVSNFTISGSFCCPAGHCIVKSTSSANPVDLVPSCQKGTPIFENGTFVSYTNELCRRENDGLQDTIQFFRGRQANATFQYRDAAGKMQPVSMADIIYVGAAAAVEACSGGKVKPQLLVGRKDANESDSAPLPDPAGVIADKHHSIFQAMGLNKIDMVTLVTGAHSVGGYRASSSPGLTSCPFVPFDCTPAGQFGVNPFDNNVYKVACNGVKGVTTGSCSFNSRCPSTTNTSSSQSINPNGTCPFGADAYPKFNACSTTGKFPSPGLVSDRFWCQNDTTTQPRMLQYASDEQFFFTNFANSFVQLGKLGYTANSLVAI